MSLDDEISHLQKENNHVDSQLHRMKSDVTGMETDAATEDKVTDKIFIFSLERYSELSLKLVRFSVFC